MSVEDFQAKPSQPWVASRAVPFSLGIMVAAKAGLMAAGPVGWVVLGTVMVGSLMTGYYSGKFFDELGVDIVDAIMVRR